MKVVAIFFALIFFGYAAAQDTSLTSTTVDTSFAQAELSKPSEATAVFIRELKVGEPIDVAPGMRYEALTALLIVYWLLFAFLRLFNYSLFRYRLQALFNANLASQYFRDQSVFSSTLHAIYHLHYLLGFSLFISYLVWYYNQPLQLPVALLVTIVLGICVGLYVLRLLAGKWMHLLFGVQESLRFAQFYSNLTYSILAFCLMPVVTIGWYGPAPWPNYAHTVGIGLCAIALLVKYFRSIQIAKGYFSIYRYHLIMYICTAEIAPVLLLVKGTNWGILLVS